MGNRRGRSLTVDQNGQVQALQSAFGYSSVPFYMNREKFHVRINKNTFVVTKFDGTESKILKFNEYPAYHGPQVAVINIKDEEILGLCVQSPSAESTSCFLAYDSNGVLFHQAVLEKARGIAVLKNNSNGRESFLVGAGTELWKYEFNKEPVR